MSQQGFRIVHISYGGEMYSIRAGGKEFYFESHPHLGPIVCGKRGEPTSIQPRQRSPFWEAERMWREGGKRVDADGWCIHDSPPNPLEGMVLIYGNTYVTKEIAQKIGL